MDAPDPWPLGKYGVPTLHFPDNRYGMSLESAVHAPEIDGAVQTIIGGGHDPWYEYPETFFSAVRTFLAEQWRDDHY